MSAIEQKQVTADEAGMRLDRWFKSHYPGLGFGRLQKLLRTGQVRVDGKRAEASTRIAKGQTVRIPPLGVELPADDRKNARPKSSKLIADDRKAIEDMLLFEDNQVMVLNKPAGLAVQGGSGLKRHLDGMLEALRFGAAERPRLVHRLDRDTSGVMVFGLSPHAQRHLGLQFEKRQVKKSYVARVFGALSPKTGTVDLPIAADWPNRPRQKVCHETGRGAVTGWRVLRQGEGESRVRLMPLTGRSHQLRVHMLSLGHPILGDPLYATGKARDFPRLMLHSEELRLRHPDGGAGGKFRAKAPF